MTFLHRYFEVGQRLRENPEENIKKLQRQGKPLRNLHGNFNKILKGKGTRSFLFEIFQIFYRTVLTSNVVKTIFSTEEKYLSHKI